MKSAYRTLLPVFLFPACLLASTSYDVTMEKKVNYNSWGAAWDTVVVVKNSIITLAAVPKLGGRVMQFDLGTHPSIYVNPNMINKTITTGDSMVGGFRQLPSPQSDFSWPAPPTLDYGQYKCTIMSTNADSCVVNLESKVEDTNDTKYVKHKGLQYTRTLTMYKASSRVKVEMVMINKEGTSTLSHGIWDITQSLCGPSNTTYDKENMWVYFPLNPNSLLKRGYVEYEQNGKRDTTQWKKNIVPGIMGVQYKQVVAKIGADCNGGWICFVDRADGYAYVKTFTYQDDKKNSYPDSGASVQVYTYKDYPNTEVEVLGPITSLAKGASVAMVENWYATRSKGPVYSVNSAGLVSKPIAATQSNDTVTVQGSYGVFYVGKVRAIFKKADGMEIAAADTYAVSPKDSFALRDTLKVPAGAAKLVLALYSGDGKLMGILDSAAVTPTLTQERMKTGSHNAASEKDLKFTRMGSVLFIQTFYHRSYSIEAIGLNGKRLLSIKGLNPTTHAINLSNLPTGVLCVRAHCAGKEKSNLVMID
jgi:hypothetical protein